ncbi:MAG: adenylyl-sulfate reductase subunit alpha [Coriobacteriales bacterium]|jgi:adenylylsulfate reductase subunit A|nr:adenylyl-sulfate reductase subunit alpha [Coriobacteriales bacterium]
MRLQTKRVTADFLIIGAGTAGCYAALESARLSNASILLVEKADIARSGCLAAGVNALNAYIAADSSPEEYVEYACKDGEQIARYDLLLSMARGLNDAVRRLEALGLVILRGPDGAWMPRGKRNIRINGENIKPLLAGAVCRLPQARVLNRTAAVRLRVRDGRVCGAFAISIDEPVLYDISAKVVLCSTGGAAGLYLPKHSGFSHHKMWDSPFNVGAGLAMGIQAGAEMTTLEMRFVALRCRDTIAPVGTLAQGVGARQVNARGEVYEQRYGLSTNQRVFGTMQEIREGRGPCYLRTVGISAEQQEDLYRAYLNMAPSQTLKWLESGSGPSLDNVGIEGTEPSIVGGHTASGYWVSTDRQTTITGLFAAGDVAGGCPQKYVTGACAEAAIVARAALPFFAEDFLEAAPDEATRFKAELDALLEGADGRGAGGGGSRGADGSAGTADAGTDDKARGYGGGAGGNARDGELRALELRMQQAMDTHAGGIGASYRFSEASLGRADEQIAQLTWQAGMLRAQDMRGLLRIQELRARLLLCRVLIAHLAARKETRWPGFGLFEDYPRCDDSWLRYVNSTFHEGAVKIRCRELVRREERYEHCDR